MDKKIEVRRLINKEYSSQAICNELEISPYELIEIIKILRKDGYYYFPKTIDNAFVEFSLKKENSDNDLNFRVPNGVFSFVYVADSHVGSIYDMPQRFDTLGEYIECEEINMLVNGGDLIDGPDHKDQSMPRRLHTIEDQVEEFAELYPYICGTNVVVLGDHDLKYKTEQIDETGRTKPVSANKLIRESRPDLKVFSSGSGIIQINNNKFLIAHQANDPRVRDRMTDDMIAITAHSHAYYNNSLYDGNRPIIRIVAPSMSDLPTYNNKMPGFLRFNLTFDDNFLRTIVIENYCFVVTDIIFNGSVTYNMPTTKQRQRK